MLHPWRLDDAETVFVYAQDFYALIEDAGPGFVILYRACAVIGYAEYGVGGYIVGVLKLIEPCS